MARLNKPTHLKLIEGNKGKRAINKHEPEPAFLNDLTAPAWLPEDVAAVWNEIAPKLRSVNVLTELDVPAVEAGCVAIAMYRYITKRIGNEFTVEGAKGGTSLNQLVIAQSMMYKKAMSFFQQFGMTPVARTRISLNLQGDLFGNEEKKTNNYLT